MPKQRQFIVRGRVTMDGVHFFVMAKDGLEAVEKIRAGDWIMVETEAAEVIDWTVRNESEPND